MEGLNPTRRYKSFRPRQAARGFIQFAATTNFPTVALYNDSTAAQYLMLRDFRTLNIDATGSQLNTGYINAKLGVQGGTVTPLVASGGKLPGILTQLEDSVTRSKDYIVDAISSNGALLSWVHDFPFAVLEPNWSFYIQSPAAADTLWFSFFWEAVFADELDYAFEL